MIDLVTDEAAELVDLVAVVRGASDAAVDTIPFGGTVSAAALEQYNECTTSTRCRKCALMVETGSYEP